MFMMYILNKKKTSVKQFHLISSLHLFNKLKNDEIILFFILAG